MLRSPVRAAIAALLLVLTSAPVAAAHAELKSATPGPGDKVVGSPTEIVATFSQNLNASRTSLEVRSADGTRLARGGEAGDGKREFRLALPDLAPGKYEVRWTSFSSEDGELGRGDYTFTVVAALSPTPTPTASATLSPSAAATASPTVASTPSGPPPPTPTASPAPEAPVPAAASDVLLPIVAALVFVAILGTWLVRRRRT